MNRPLFAMFDMIHRSSMIAAEIRENDEARQNAMGSFALGDLSEPEFSRAMRHLGASDDEIAEFIRFTKGEE
jgi:hypothetical protein